MISHCEKVFPLKCSPILLCGELTVLSSLVLLALKNQWTIWVPIIIGVRIFFISMYEIRRRFLRKGQRIVLLSNQLIIPDQRNLVVYILNNMIVPHLINRFKNLVGRERGLELKDIIHIYLVGQGSSAVIVLSFETINGLKSTVIHSNLYRYDMNIEYLFLEMKDFYSEKFPHIHWHCLCNFNGRYLMANSGRFVPWINS